MVNIIPAPVKQSVEQIRDSVMNVFDKFIPEKYMPEKAKSDTLLSPLTLFAQGGPLIDVYEDDNTVYVNAELPGLTQEDFSVELSQNYLVIKGEKKAQHTEKKNDYTFSECSYGSFARSIALPCKVNEDQIEATFKHGVLKIQLPKDESAKAKRVNITVG